MEDESEMVVKRVSVPLGLEELMETLTKEVLRKKPDDIYTFASEYFARLLSIRNEGGYRVPRTKMGKDSTRFSKRTLPREYSKQDLLKVKSVTGSAVVLKKELPPPLLVRKINKRHVKAKVDSNLSPKPIENGINGAKVKTILERRKQSRDSMRAEQIRQVGATKAPPNLKRNAIKSRIGSTNSSDGATRTRTADNEQKNDNNKVANATIVSEMPTPPKTEERKDLKTPTSSVSFDRAVIMLQSVIRGFIARRRMKKEQKPLEVTLCVEPLIVENQTTEVGDLISAGNTKVVDSCAEPFLVDIDTSRHKAAMKIQSAWKTYKARMNDRLRYPEESAQYKYWPLATKEQHKAATVIQALFRGYLSRKHIRDVINNREKLSALPEVVFEGEDGKSTPNPPVVAVDSMETLKELENATMPKKGVESEEIVIGTSPEMPAADTKEREEELKVIIEDCKNSSEISSELREEIDVNVDLDNADLEESANRPVSKDSMVSTDSVDTVIFSDKGVQKSDNGKIANEEEEDRVRERDPVDGQSLLEKEVITNGVCAEAEAESTKVKEEEVNREITRYLTSITEPLRRAFSADIPSVSDGASKTLKERSLSAKEPDSPKYIYIPLRQYTEDADNDEKILQVPDGDRKQKVENNEGQQSSKDVNEEISEYIGSLVEPVKRKFSADVEVQSSVGVVKKSVEIEPEYEYIPLKNYGEDGEYLLESSNGERVQNDQLSRTVSEQIDDIILEANEVVKADDKHLLDASNESKDVVEEESQKVDGAASDRGDLDPQQIHSRKQSDIELEEIQSPPEDDVDVTKEAVTDTSTVTGVDKDKTDDLKQDQKSSNNDVIGDEQQACDEIRNGNKQVNDAPNAKDNVIYAKENDNSEQYQSSITNDVVDNQQTLDAMKNKEHFIDTNKSCVSDEDQKRSNSTDVDNSQKSSINDGVEDGHQTRDTLKIKEDSIDTNKNNASGEDQKFPPPHNTNDNPTEVNEINNSAKEPLKNDFDNNHRANQTTPNINDNVTAVNEINSSAQDQKCLSYEIYTNKDVSGQDQKFSSNDEIVDNNQQTPYINEIHSSEHEPLKNDVTSDEQQMRDMQKSKEDSIYKGDVSGQDQEVSDNSDIGNNNEPPNDASEHNDNVTGVKEIDNSGQDQGSLNDDVVHDEQQMHDALSSKEDNVSNQQFWNNSQIGSNHQRTNDPLLENNDNVTNVDKIESSGQDQKSLKTVVVDVEQRMPNVLKSTEDSINNNKDDVSGQDQTISSNEIGNHRENDVPEEKDNGQDEISSKNGVADDEERPPDALKCKEDSIDTNKDGVSGEDQKLPNNDEIVDKNQLPDVNDDATDINEIDTSEQEKKALKDDVIDDEQQTRDDLKNKEDSIDTKKDDFPGEDQKVSNSDEIVDNNQFPDVINNAGDINDIDTLRQSRKPLKNGVEDEQQTSDPLESKENSICTNKDEGGSSEDQKFADNVDHNQQTNDTDMNVSDTVTGQDQKLSYGNEIVDNNQQLHDTPKDRDNVTDVNEISSGENQKSLNNDVIVEQQTSDALKSEEGPIDTNKDDFSNRDQKFSSGNEICNNNQSANDTPPDSSKHDQKSVSIVDVDDNNQLMCASLKVDENITDTNKIRKLDGDEQVLSNTNIEDSLEQKDSDKDQRDQLHDALSIEEPVIHIKQIGSLEQDQKYVDNKDVAGHSRQSRDTISDQEAAFDRNKRNSFGQDQKSVDETVITKNQVDGLGRDQKLLDNDNVGDHNQQLRNVLIAGESINDDNEQTHDAAKLKRNLTDTNKINCLEDNEKFSSGTNINHNNQELQTGLNAEDDEKDADSLKQHQRSLNMDNAGDHSQQSLDALSVEKTVTVTNKNDCLGQEEHSPRESDKIDNNQQSHTTLDAEETGIAIKKVESLKQDQMFLNNDNVNGNNQQSCSEPEVKNSIIDANKVDSFGHDETQTAGNVEEAVVDPIRADSLEKDEKHSYSGSVGDNSQHKEDALDVKENAMYINKSDSLVQHQKSFVSDENVSDVNKVEKFLNNGDVEDNNREALVTTKNVTYTNKSDSLQEDQNCLNDIDDNSQLQIGANANKTIIVTNKPDNLNKDERSPNTNKMEDNNQESQSTLNLRQDQKYLNNENVDNVDQKSQVELEAPVIDEDKSSSLGHSQTLLKNEDIDVENQQRDDAPKTVGDVVNINSVVSSGQDKKSVDAYKFCGNNQQSRDGALSTEETVTDARKTDTLGQDENYLNNDDVGNNYQQPDAVDSVGQNRNSLDGSDADGNNQQPETALNTEENVTELKDSSPDDCAVYERHGSDALENHIRNKRSIEELEGNVLTPISNGNVEKHETTPNVGLEVARSSSPEIDAEKQHSQIESEKGYLEESKELGELSEVNSVETDGKEQKSVSDKREISGNKIESDNLDDIENSRTVNTSTSQPVSGSGNGENQEVVVETEKTVPAAIHNQNEENKTEDVFDEINPTLNISKDQSISGSGNGEDQKSGVEEEKTIPVEIHNKNEENKIEDAADGTDRALNTSKSRSISASGNGEDQKIDVEEENTIPVEIHNQNEENKIEDAADGTDRGLNTSNSQSISGSGNGEDQKIGVEEENTIPVEIHNQNEENKIEDAVDGTNGALNTSKSQSISGSGNGEDQKIGVEEEKTIPVEIHNQNEKNKIEDAVDGTNRALNTSKSQSISGSGNGEDQKIGVEEENTIPVEIHLGSLENLGSKELTSTTSEDTQQDYVYDKEKGDQKLLGDEKTCEIFVTPTKSDGGDEFKTANGTAEDVVESDQKDDIDRDIQKDDDGKKSTSGDLVTKTDVVSVDASKTENVVMKEDRKIPETEATLSQDGEDSSTLTDNTSKENADNKSERGELRAHEDGSEANAMTDLYVTTFNSTDFPTESNKVCDKFTVYKLENLGFGEDVEGVKSVSPIEANHSVLGSLPSLPEENAEETHTDVGANNRTSGKETETKAAPFYLHRQTDSPPATISSSQEKAFSKAFPKNGLERYDSVPMKGNLGSSGSSAEEEEEEEETTDNHRQRSVLCNVSVVESPQSTSAALPLAFEMSQAPGRVFVIIQVLRP